MWVWFETQAPLDWEKQRRASVRRMGVETGQRLAPVAEYFHPSLYKATAAVPLIAAAAAAAVAVAQATVAVAAGGLGTAAAVPALAVAVTAC